jgi:hypothetical protein
MSLKLSNSQLRRLRLCARKLQYEVVERRPTFSASPAQVRGSTAHETIAANLNHWRSTHRYMKPRALAEHALSSFGAQAFLVDWKRETDTTRDATQDQAICMALAHSRHVAQDIVPLDVELNVSAYVPEVGAEMVGVIDVVSAPVFVATSTGPGGRVTADHRDRQIRDTKTSDDSPGSVPDDNDADQLAIYALITKALGDTPADLIVDYLWPRDNGKARSLPVLDLEARTPRLVEDLRDLNRTYATGLFPRTGRGTWLCKPGKCEWYDYCVLGSGRTDL